MPKLFTFKNKRRLPAWLAWPLALLAKLIFLTYRIKIDDREKILADNLTAAFIFACWHNRILFTVPLLPRACRQKLSMLISASRDGEYIATLAKLFQLKVVRGSSSRGGLAAMLEMKARLHRGDSVGITVDGPRGPRYCVHAGVAALAAYSEARVVPLISNFTHYWELNSWDKMQIPVPFTTITVRVGQPIVLDGTADHQQNIESIRQEMLALTQDKER
ncbi:MAG: lysophospholipid acyltransferase family protein [Oligosphaeraceae bacterium]|nr:lysophospholipid acyltransferase family protein [Oligosphaeraceae bacterium]